jgi:hypothetical protein
MTRERETFYRANLLYMVLRKARRHNFIYITCIIMRSRRLYDCCNIRTYVRSPTRRIIFSAVLGKTRRGAHLFVIHTYFNSFSFLFPTFIRTYMGRLREEFCPMTSLACKENDLLADSERVVWKVLLRLH